MTFTKISDINRRHLTDGWRSARAPRWCPGCGETRMVTETTMWGQTKLYCEVCSTEWAADPESPALDVNGNPLTGP